MKIKFIIIRAGVNKLNGARMPYFSGDSFEIKKDTINATAKILLSKKKILLINDNLFLAIINFKYHFLPTVNKKSFSSLVKVS